MPLRPKLVPRELLKASLIDGLEFILIRVVSLNKCELLTSELGTSEIGSKRKMSDCNHEMNSQS